MSAESPSGASPESEAPATELEEAADQLDTEAIGEEKKTTLELDQVFEILKNQRRRYVLQYLKEVDETVSMSDLAEEIAAWENDKAVSQLSSSERKRVYVGLYQCHLPKMDGMGVVEFNKPRGRIKRGPNATVFDEYIETETESDDLPWSRIQVATAAAGAVVFGLALVLQSYVSLPVVMLAGLAVVVGNAGCSLAHMRWKRNDADGGSD